MVGCEDNHSALNASSASEKIVIDRAVIFSEPLYIMLREPFFF